MPNFRQLINNNSAAVTVAAVVLLVASLAIIIYTNSGTGAGMVNPDMYFMDLNTGELFVGKAADTPPIVAPSGDWKGAQPGTPAGAKAYVYACGDCADASKRFIGYVEMYTPEAKAKMQKMQEAMKSGEPNPEMYMMEQDMESGRMVAGASGTTPPGPRDFVQAMSEQGMKLMEAIGTRCPEGERLRLCRPEK